MNANQTDAVKRYADKIERRYDPEHDAGAVTWCDYQLVQMIRRLVVVVEDLQDQVNNLQSK